MATRLQRARIGTFLTFALAAALSAAWTVRVPAMVDKLHLQPGSVGIVVLCWGGGALVTMQFTRQFLVAVGTRRALRYAGPATTATLALVGLAPTYPLLLGASAIFGMAFGVLDIAMNTQAAAIERAYDRHLMNGFHAGWSVGAVSGGLLGSLAAVLGLSFTATLVWAAAIGTPLSVLLWPTYLRDEEEQHDADASRGRVPAIVYLVGFIAFAAFMIEGSVADWSSLFVTDDIRAGQALAALSYPAFESGALVGRLFGDRVRTSLGTRTLLSIAGLATSAAFALVLTSTTWQVAVVGFFAIGLAVSTVAPLAFSLAGDIDPARAGAFISITGTFGYGGLLLGPVVIGLLADAASLRVALTVAVALGLAITVSGRILPTHWRLRARETPPEQSAEAPTRRTAR